MSRGSFLARRAQVSSGWRTMYSHWSVRAVAIAHLVPNAMAQGIIGQELDHITRGEEELVAHRQFVAVARAWLSSRMARRSSWPLKY